MEDFKRMFIDGERLTTVQILYYLPDYENLVQEFIWQTLDLKPTFPRVNRFVTYWHENIEARIKEIIVCCDDQLIPPRYRHAKWYFEL